MLLYLKFTLKLHQLASMDEVFEFIIEVFAAQTSTYKYLQSMASLINLNILIMFKIVKLDMKMQL